MLPISSPFERRSAISAAVATAPSRLTIGASMQRAGPTTAQLSSLEFSGGLCRPAKASLFSRFASRTSGSMRYPCGFGAQITIWELSGLGAEGEHSGTTTFADFEGG